MEVDGTLCFVDISGFTALSEKLAARGRVGAEELTEVLSRVFGEMLDLVANRGGVLLKFGGDALLLLFTGYDHATRAASAAVEMRTALRTSTQSPTTAGRVHLRMSVGIHSGPIHIFRVGSMHKELVIAGVGGTTTTAMEKAADPGEILVSRGTRDRLPADATGKAKGAGWLLRWRKAHCIAPGPVARDARDPESLRAWVPVELREYLGAGDTEPEHRIASVGFVRFCGVDQRLDVRAMQHRRRADDCRVHTAASQHLRHRPEGRTPPGAGRPASRKVVDSGSLALLPSRLLAGEDPWPRVE